MKKSYPEILGDEKILSLFRKGYEPRGIYGDVAVSILKKDGYTAYHLCDGSHSSIETTTKLDSDEMVKDIVRMFRIKVKWLLG